MRVSPDLTYTTHPPPINWPPEDSNWLFVASVLCLLLVRILHLIVVQDPLSTSVGVGNRPGTGGWTYSGVEVSCPGLFNTFVLLHVISCIYMYVLD